MTRFPVLLLTLLAFPLAMCAQERTALPDSGVDAAVVPSQAIRGLLINGTVPLQQVENSVDALVDRVGDPERWVRHADPVLGTVDHIVEYPGATFRYTDYGGPLTLTRMEIVGPGTWVRYRGTEIRVGMALGEIMAVFPDAYELRQGDRLRLHVARSDASGRIIRRPDGQAELSSTVFTVEFDPVTGTVVRILYDQRVT